MEVRAEYDRFGFAVESTWFFHNERPWIDVTYRLEGGWTDEKKEQFAEHVIATIEQYAPNIRRAIIGKQIITPVDIERIAGISGGNIFHGELLLHQLFFLRPAPQWADFRTPLPGYYLAASGAHPGGGVMGAAGKLAAQEILKDGLR